MLTGPEVAAEAAAAEQEVAGATVTIGRAQLHVLAMAAEALGLIWHAARLGLYGFERDDVLEQLPEELWRTRPATPDEVEDGLAEAGEEVADLVPDFEAAIAHAVALLEDADAKPPDAPTNDAPPEP